MGTTGQGSDFPKPLTMMGVIVLGDNLMKDHEYIESNQIIDRYVMGKLTDDENQWFSNHFMSCPDCIEQLDLAEAFQRDLKTVVAHDATKAVVHTGLLVRLASARGMVTLACAALILFGFSFTLKNLSVPEFESYDLLSVSRNNQEVEAMVIALSAHPNIILQKDLMMAEDEADASFKMTLLGDTGEAVMTHTQKITNGKALVVLESATLMPGNYKCRVEITRDGAAYELYGEYPLTMKP